MKKAIWRLQEVKAKQSHNNNKQKNQNDHFY